MTALDEAWTWYHETKELLKIIRRLADRYWDQLPWDHDLGKDNVLRNLEGPPLASAAVMSLEALDDLAILLLFSSFEAVVRNRLRVEIEEARKTIEHPVLQSSAEDALQAINRGSFHRVLLSLRAIDPALVEQVRQIRRYRNWVSHGRRGAKPPQVDPKTAYDRLTAFLRLLDR